MTKKTNTPRREFLGKLTAGTVAGLASLSPFATSAAETAPAASANDAEAWFKKIKGTHRVVFDAPHPNEIAPFGGPRVFLISNSMVGVPQKDCGVVVVLRHTAICYAFDDHVWAKYKLGEFSNAPDPLTGKPATRNPFNKPKPGDFKAPGFGNVAVGINELQADGVLFCVCDIAITVTSAAIAEQTQQDAAAIRKDLVAALLPGIQPMPSGVWAVSRAQAHGCGYCFTG